MSDNIPIEIQLDIMKRLPVKSLIQFRSVCKAWKSLIDSADFIKNYSGKTQYLLARYKDTVDIQEKFIIIADDYTFPHTRVSLNTHLLVNMLPDSRIIGSSHGLLCLYGDYSEGCDGPLSGTGRAVIWNPSIRKVVAVDVPNVADNMIYGSLLGFGVCSDTNDPKIVKITLINLFGHMKSVTCIPCQVEVFTLSTTAWRLPYSTNLPRNSIEFEEYRNVVIDGMLYWLVTDRITIDGGSYNNSNLIISFDMTSEEFREVNLPHSLAYLPHYMLSLSKVSQSLVVVEYGVGANSAVFCAWMMEDGVPNSFTKQFNITLPDVCISEVKLTGFRRTGEPIIDSLACYTIEPIDDRLAHYPEWTGSLAIYEPYSKSISSLGIDGSDFSDFVYSHKETLLLL